MAAAQTSVIRAIAFATSATGSRLHSRLRGLTFAGASAGRFGPAIRVCAPNWKAPLSAALRCDSLLQGRRLSGKVLAKAR